jgi:hypothetical protein
MKSKVNEARSFKLYFMISQTQSAKQIIEKRLSHRMSVDFNTVLAGWSRFIETKLKTV